MAFTDCIPRTDWFGLTTGLVIFGAGVVLIATVVGAIIGIPMVLASLGLFTDAKTLRGTPCA